MLATGLIAFLLTARASSAASLAEVPCWLDPAGTPPARCYELTVADGAYVLPVVELPAEGRADPAAPPLIVVNGGPGASLFGPGPKPDGTTGPDGILRFWRVVTAPFRADRAVLLMDMRGVGPGRPSLACTELEDIGLPETAGDVSAPLASCRRRLEAQLQRGELSAEAFAADILALADALGAPRMAVLGFSHGSRVALTVAHRAPGRVAALILDGVHDTGPAAPFDDPAALAAALDRYDADCRAAGACSGLPPLRTLADQVIAAAQAAPVSIALQAALRPAPPASGVDHTIQYGGSEAAGAIYTALAEGELIGTLHPLLAADANGRTYWLAGLTPTVLSDDRSLAEAVHLTVRCRELGLPGGSRRMLPDQSLAQFARADPMAALCRAFLGGMPPLPGPGWTAPAGLLPGVPALLLSGRYDPVTPLEVGEALAKGHPSATHLAFRTGHGVLAESACARAVAARFLREGGRRLSRADLPTCYERALLADPGFTRSLDEARARIEGRPAQRRTE